MITWNHGGQTGDQTRKVGRQQTKSSRIGDLTGHNIEPCILQKVTINPLSFYRFINFEMIRNQTKN